VAGKADFTESEWDELQKGVTGAGMLVALSDRGFFDTFKEAGALTKHLAAARQATDSQLVREVAEVRGTGFGLTTSSQKVEAETVEALRSTVTLLATKAPDELDAYREFVLGVARSVSEAAGGGDASESEAIATIADALG
jgi:tellurite resistance protein